MTPNSRISVAGTVGGILANATRPAEFIQDSLPIHARVMDSSDLFGVSKLLCLGGCRLSAARKLR